MKTTESRGFKHERIERSPRALGPLPGRYAAAFRHFVRGDLAWRPRPDAFSCAQQLLHIIQNEDYFISGLFGNDWSVDRLTFPKPMPAKQSLHQQFLHIRRRTRSVLSSLDESTLNESGGTGTHQSTLRFARGSGSSWSMRFTTRGSSASIFERSVTRHRTLRWSFRSASGPISRRGLTLVACDSAVVARCFRMHGAQRLARMSRVLSPLNH